MADLFLDNIYLALLIPFWIFLIVMVGRFFSVYVNKNILYILTLISSAFGIVLCSGALLKLPTDKILETSSRFIAINDFVIEFGLCIDKTSLIFGLVLFLISFFVQLFSVSYMKNEQKNYRFYALINLFNFSMASLFFSVNLFQAYFFWEIISVISYLLIGFEYNLDIKSLASKKVFILNRFGDTSLLAGLILTAYFIYEYAPNKSLVTLSFTDINTISTLLYAYATSPIFETICILFIISALVKSAQFPFFNWLQDAMEAKLPVSALLHSSTLVAAGVFLTLRLLPFYSLETFILKIVAIIGILTAFICSISAIAQTNPKKVLAYSTSAQFGLIYFAIGMLNIKAAIAFFIAHAFIKSMLFLTLPNKNEKWNYLKFVGFLIAGLSLSGLIFSGLIAKEMIVLNLNNFLIATFSILSFLTAFYIIRIALVIFDNNGIEKIKPQILELISISGLLILNILFYIYLHKNAQYNVAECFYGAFTAWVVVYILYIKKAFWKVPLLYNLALNGFYLDKFYNYFCVKFYKLLTDFCNVIETKLFGNYSLIIKCVNIGVKSFAFIENKIFNGTINYITKIFRKISLLDLRIQNGNIQCYNMYAFMLIILIALSLVIGYIILLFKL